METSGLQVKSEACHENQLWHGEMTVNGTILTMGVLPLDKACVHCFQREKYHSLRPWTILNKVHSNRFSFGLERRSGLCLLGLFYCLLKNCFVFSLTYILYLLLNTHAEVAPRKWIFSGKLI